MKNTKTVNISMNMEDIANIDSYCNAHNLTRSKFMIQAALEKVQTEQIANTLLMINDSIKKMRNGKILDDKDVKVIQYLKDMGFGDNVKQEVKQ